MDQQLNVSNQRSWVYFCSTLHMAQLPQIVQLMMFVLFCPLFFLGVHGVQQDVGKNLEQGFNESINRRIVLSR